MPVATVSVHGPGVACCQCVNFVCASTHTWMIMSNDNTVNCSVGFTHTNNTHTRTQAITAALVHVSRVETYKYHYTTSNKYVWHEKL